MEKYIKSNKIPVLASKCVMGYNCRYDGKN